MSQDELGHTILAREEERCAALRAGDVTALASLLSERLVFAHANATSDTKESLLAKLGSGGIVYAALSLEGTNVIPAGEDAALLTAKLTAQVIVRGVQKIIQNMVLLVWAREEGTWRLLAYQPTPLPAASAT